MGSNLLILKEGTCPESHRLGPAGHLALANNPDIIHIDQTPFPPSAPKSIGAPLAEACICQEPLSLILPARSQHRGERIKASSLLGGSQGHPCGQKGSPYLMGQLHPVVCVINPLQHINQVKAAEDYGFRPNKDSAARCMARCTSSPALASASSGSSSL